MTRALLLFAALLALAAAEVPEWTKCEESNDDVCSISEVRVDPCKEIKYCKLKKGNRATIDIDFTPKFASSSLKTGFYWASDQGDLPFADLNGANACELTACPLEPGKKQTFTYSIYVNKKLPSGKFLMKWKMWSGDNVSQLCCFKMNVELKKAGKN